MFAELTSNELERESIPCFPRLLMPSTRDVDIPGTTSRCRPRPLRSAPSCSREFSCKAASSPCPARDRRARRRRRRTTYLRSFARIFFARPRAGLRHAAARQPVSGLGTLKYEPTAPAGRVRGAAVRSPPPHAATPAAAIPAALPGDGRRHAGLLFQRWRQAAPGEAPPPGFGARVRESNVSRRAREQCVEARATLRNPRHGKGRETEPAAALPGSRRRLRQGKSAKTGRGFALFSSRRRTSAAESPRKQIGFHVRERGATYRVRTKRRI